MEKALTQLEHHSREVHSYTDFSATDMLDYLQQEAAQPNDHEQRLLVGDSGAAIAQRPGPAAVLGGQRCNGAHSGLRR